MGIKIDNIKTLRVESFKIEPEDRQEIIEVVGGVVVQDFGSYEAGDKISCKVSVKTPDAKEIVKAARKRTKVTLEYEGGEKWTSRRVRVKSYGYRSRFPEVCDMELEFWGA